MNRIYQLSSRRFGALVALLLLVASPVGSANPQGTFLIPPKMVTKITSSLSGRMGPGANKDAFVIPQKFHGEVLAALNGAVLSKSFEGKPLGQLTVTTEKGASPLILFHSGEKIYFAVQGGPLAAPGFYEAKTLKKLKETIEKAKKAG